MQDEYVRGESLVYPIHPFKSEGAWARGVLGKPKEIVMDSVDAKTGEIVRRALKCYRFHRISYGPSDGVDSGDRVSRTVLLPGNVILTDALEGVSEGTLIDVVLGDVAKIGGGRSIKHFAVYPLVKREETP